MTSSPTSQLRMTPEMAAFCRGFLLTKCDGVGRACVFCRAFLVKLYGPL